VVTSARPWGTTAPGEAPEVPNPRAGVPGDGRTARRVYLKRPGAHGSTAGLRAEIAGKQYQPLIF
jgi:hypothetical protein